MGSAAGVNIAGSGNVVIGAGVGGAANDNNVTRIRNIGNSAQDTGIYVTLDAVGGTKLGYVNRSSARRFKEDIKPMDKASEAILALKPVTFRYKKEIDPERTQQFGLVAEQVEKVNPDLVARDAEGKLYSVRYEAVDAMLLNEFLKEHRTVQNQQKEIDALKAELREQKALIQKVSAQLEVSKAAPQTVLNNR